MNFKHFKAVLSLILCAVLIAVMALVATGCSDNKNDHASLSSQEEISSLVSSESDTSLPTVGEGKKSFSLTITDQAGKKTVLIVKTDKKTVGEALIDNKLIEGEQGEYGLYIKKVMGIKADYDTDKTYWSFYIDGQYALTGVDSTKIDEKSKYELKIEKG